MNVWPGTLMERNFSRGFLPPADPLVRLPGAFDAWEDVAQDLSKLALTRYLRPTVESLPPFATADLRIAPEYERAMTLFSYMASLYVFAPDHEVSRRLPPGLAVPWHEIAAQLGRPPILSYASQALHNWRRIDPGGPIAVGNLVLIQNFLGGMDEEWFVTIHTHIEAVAGRALAVLLPAQQAARAGDARSLESFLTTIAGSLQDMHDLLQRMPERCDPHIYYYRMRPFMFGWKDNPSLPGGMIYEGVAAYGGRPQQFRGETGAQSSIIPAIDAALGIEHQYDAMRAYLMEMRDYMPPHDRAFIEALERGQGVRAFVAANRGRFPACREAYNECVKRLFQFRQLHLEFAAAYIIAPAPPGTSAAVGTGGTPFTVYLKKHKRETADHLI